MNAGGADGRAEVRGIVVPVGKENMLLPAAAVAEVIGYQKPTPYEAAPPWLLGAVIWHEQAVPLVSVIAAEEGAESVQAGQRARIVVCYTPDGNPKLPYVSFLAIGPPWLARFRAETLDPAAQSTSNPFVLHALTFEKGASWIPRMDAVEREVLQALKS
jgi:chemotaxis signal transduction protein